MDGMSVMVIMLVAVTVGAYSMAPARGGNGVHDFGAVKDKKDMKTQPAAVAVSSGRVASSSGTGDSSATGHTLPPPTETATDVSSGDARARWQRKAQ